LESSPIESFYLYPAVETMEVILESVIIDKKQIIVYFSTNIGTATATWNAPPPITGEKYDVELDINDEFVWGENAHYEYSENHSFYIENGGYSISGTLISVGADDTAVLNIAGSIVMFSLVGYAGIIPAHITLKAKHLSIAPTGI